MPAMLRRQAHGARNTMNYIPSPTCRVHLAPPSSVKPVEMPEYYWLVVSASVHSLPDFRPPACLPRWVVLGARETTCIVAAGLCSNSR